MTTPDDDDIERRSEMTRPDFEQHRALYGDLDPFAVMPFVAPGRYCKEPLSPEGQRLAGLLHQAIQADDSIAATLRFRLALMMGALGDGDRYGAALHRQQINTLLAQFRDGISRAGDRDTHTS